MNFKNKKYLILILFFIAIISIAYYVSKSKYTFLNNSIHAQNSEEFYFNSNILKEDDPEIIFLNDWDGESVYSFKFKISNYDDLLRKNTLETRYSVVATANSNNVLITNNKNEDGIIEANKNIDDEVEITLETINGYKPSEIIVNVEVTSTYPYKKVLYGAFKIKNIGKTEKYDLNIDNTNNDYAKLLIKTNNYNGPLTLSYNNTKIIPENQNPLVKNAVKGTGTITINLLENTNYEIDFIKFIPNEIIELGQGKDIEIRE